MPKKYVYFFGGAKADGDGSMRNLLQLEIGRASCRERV